MRDELRFACIETVGERLELLPRGSGTDNCKGARGPERGARFLRGETSEGGKIPNGCGTKQGRETRTCWETAERLRKPASGTEADLNTLPHKGLVRGMSLGTNKPWKLDPIGRSDGRKVRRNFKRAQRQTGMNFCLWTEGTGLAGSLRLRA
jgi:hypothetical protein